MWKISPVYFMGDKWLKILEKYSDKLLFGTDMTGYYNLQSMWVKSYEYIFSQLNARAVNNIVRGNILRLCY